MNKVNKSVSSHGNERTPEAPVRSSWIRKNEVNLQKRGSFYFQVGLVIAMLLVYYGLEASFRTAVIEPIIIDSPNDIPTELVQILPFKKVESPVKNERTKKVTNPSIIIIKEDPFISVSKDVINTVDPSDNLSIDSIAYQDPNKNEPETILINVIEEVPIFPGCESVAPSEQLACFNEKMNAHIRRNFNYPEVAMDLGIQGRVNVSFTINEYGTVSHLQFRGPSPVLEKEAKRIILKLPKMIPGKQGGKSVRVPYSIPIHFKIK